MTTSSSSAHPRALPPLALPNVGGNQLNPAVAAALAVLDTISAALDEELAALDKDHDGIAPAAAARHLVTRLVPDIGGLLAPHLHELPSASVAVVLDDLFVRSPLTDRRMRNLTPRLQAHLDDYARSLTRWTGWRADTVDLYRRGHHVDGDGAVRWVTAWERPDDGAVAADLVGYVKDPADLARPGGEFAVFARDASAVLQWLEDEYGDRAKGLRLWILGADDRHVVRWLPPE